MIISNNILPAYFISNKKTQPDCFAYIPIYHLYLYIYADIVRVAKNIIFTILYHLEDFYYIYVDH